MLTYRNPKIVKRGTLQVLFINVIGILIWGDLVKRHTITPYPSALYCFPILFVVTYLMNTRFPRKSTPAAPVEIGIPQIKLLRQMACLYTVATGAAIIYFVVNPSLMAVTMVVVGILLSLFRWNNLARIARSDLEKKRSNSDAHAPPSGGANS